MVGHRISHRTTPTRSVTTARSRLRLRERPGRERERATGGDTLKHRAGTRPARTSSGVPVSPATASVAGWSVLSTDGSARTDAGDPLAANRRPGRTRTDWSGSPPGTVGAECYAGRQRRAGRTDTFHTNIRQTTLTRHHTPGGTERGRSLDVPRRRKHRRNEERSETRSSSGRGRSRWLRRAHLLLSKSIRSHVHNRGGHVHGVVCTVVEFITEPLSDRCRESTVGLRGRDPCGLAAALAAVPAGL